MTLVVNQAETRAALPFPALIEALKSAFIQGADVPLRHRHSLPNDATLLLMPAWQNTAALGVKIVTVHPTNSSLGLNAVHSTYLLADGKTGRPLALIDGQELTARRTAAASALAGTYLARPDSATLLICGAGHIGSLMHEAWSAIRPITRTLIWTRRPEQAEALAARLPNATAVENLESAVREADIISTATLATTPLIHGAWLRPGTHLDLIGAYRPDMREADDTALARARIFIDTPAAPAESGDLPPGTEIAGDLAALCKNEIPGRTAPGDITLFKSVGSAIEDLAAAMLIWRETKPYGTPT
jgi:ornithine cyclodeaminase